MVAEKLAASLFPRPEPCHGVGAGEAVSAWSMTLADLRVFPIAEWRSVLVLGTAIEFRRLQ